MIPFHPLANIFPLMTGPEFEALVQGMKDGGFMVGEEIVLLDGMILDGRNRYRAAVAAGIFDADVNPLTRWEFVQFGQEGLDGVFDDITVARGPLLFVIAKNLHRRHLNESQRATAAARVANLEVGRPRNEWPGGPDNSANLPNISQAQAAEMLNVSTRLVGSARRVLHSAPPEVVAAVDEGRLAASAAADLLDLPAEEQLRIVADGGQGEALGRKVRTEVKKKKRNDREAARGNRIMALPDKKYGVIVEDFEWDHVTWSDAGRDRAAENHYTVSRDAHTAAEIVERTKERFAVAAPDCVCFMWATIQHLAIAIDVLRLRGFDYKSHYAWGKDKIGLGFWNREKHELLLIGVKGKVDCPAQGTQWDSLVMEPRGEHSEKPPRFLEMIEGWFPVTPKIELNARQRRPGWDAWGNDLPDDEPAAPTAAPAGAPDELQEEIDKSTPAAVREEAGLFGLTEGAIPELIDANGMVHLIGGTAVAARYVTPQEWAMLDLAREALASKHKSNSAVTSQASHTAAESRETASGCEITGPPCNDGRTGGDAARHRVSPPELTREVRCPCCMPVRNARMPKPDELEIPPFLRRRNGEAA